MIRTLFSVFVCFLSLVSILGSPSDLRAAQFEFEKVEIGAEGTAVLGINDEGVVVGGYYGRACQGDDCFLVPHGFLLNKQGDLTPIDFPGAAWTIPTAINNSGEIVGIYGGGSCRLENCAFAYKGGQYTDIRPPVDISDAGVVDAQGINNQGFVVGLFRPGSQDDRGYIRYPDGRYWVLSGDEGPFGAGFEFSDINSQGEIIGFGTTGNREDSFLRSSNGSYEVISRFTPTGPVIDTQVEGMNARGEIVGNVTPPGCEALECGQAFYRDPNGDITDLEIAGADRIFASKINASGTVVGFYIDDDGMHGFVASRTSVLP